MRAPDSSLPRTSSTMPSICLLLFSRYRCNDTHHKVHSFDNSDHHNDRYRCNDTHHKVHSFDNSDHHNDRHHKLHSFDNGDHKNRYCCNDTHRKVCTFDHGDHDNQRYCWNDTHHKVRTFDHGDHDNDRKQYWSNRAVIYLCYFHVTSTFSSHIWNGIRTNSVCNNKTDATDTDLNY